MKTIECIFFAVLFLFPFITSSKETTLPTEAGTEVILETSHFGQREVTHSRTKIMKQENRVRMEETIDVGGEEKFTGISIYDGHSTSTISSEGREKSEGFRGYPWTYPLNEETSVRSGKLEGRDVRIVDVERGRLYLDPEEDIILLDERGKYKIYYRDYSLVEGVGYIPRTIEKMDQRGDLIMKTELKKVEHFKTFSNDTFDPDKVEVYIAPERRDVPN
ncbi:hypothetical protein CH333_02840 [candidate division WOR-3 bacterium JGI_Cruoil_03_44_89]|uniref:Uncharacterized protein n=1 Tax=candidate division WOR-3 bacterium JGI_Cruoil_03_44_89 TaxID=1973748 RepID=A0A235BWW5_UNCW3|nr:MAG: hypothetical protein CH333_02840 [candidate division WOR-3 bacterium JGI_Cruoil_03_44_89]